MIGCMPDHVCPFASSALTSARIGSISSARFNASPAPCSLGPLTHACPPKQVAVRPCTSHPQATRYFMLFHVRSSVDFMQVRAANTKVDHSLQLMTSCDFGAPALSQFQCAMSSKSTEEYRHLGSQTLTGNQMLKCSAKTVEQSMAIGIPVRWWGTGTIEGIQIPNFQSWFFSLNKSRIVNDTQFQNRLQISKVELNFSIRLM